ncbi:MAG: FAD-dependent monooxygenase, partial [Verrucomicrobia bacterium]|nr:FAD-dependent monooxygenase [Verrucomicrobiota bacterium]
MDSTSLTTSSVTSGDAIRTRCVIVGGGPAGMMAGYLLARAGVDVVVLEKHA